MRSSSDISEKRFLGNISTSSLRNLLPKSISNKRKSISFLGKPKSDAENTLPLDSNIQIDHGEVDSAITKQARPEINRSDCQRSSPASLEPPVKEEIAAGVRDQCEVPLPSESPVKVVVRIRPGSHLENGVERKVKKVSSDALCVGDRKFSFDSVLDSESNQEDVFQLVGVPLVKNALAGYNNTILSYGQSGSGKSYTMWGPPSSIFEDSSLITCHGIVPRIFRILFSNIQKEKENSGGKQINYQCRCSFLEIYNEQIGDLLDPTQRNLEVKDDPKNGLYVENLTEEYVTKYEDMAQILLKGLSSRKVGAIGTNSESSRSHIVLTCIIESWCKGPSSKGFSNSKTSRISIVDLAGLDQSNQDVVGKQESMESKQVKKSLSKFGHLVDILAKGSQSGKHEDSLYRGSCLTHLMRESLGGNSKLTVICAVSPDDNADVLRTLRFGQLVKSIRNEPVINEVNEDGVNDLSDKIRLLKEELIKVKSNVNGSTGNTFGYFNGKNARENLSQLRVSLNRSLILPRIEYDDYVDDVNVDMQDVRELCQQLDDKLHGSSDGNSRHFSNNRDSIEYLSVDESSETDLMSEDDYHCPEENEIEEINLDVSLRKFPQINNATSTETSSPKSSEADDLPLRSRLSINLCRQSSILQEPTLSESPKLGNIQNKSLTFSSSVNNVSESSKFKPNVLRQSLGQSEIRSSLQSNKIFPGPTQSLAASLQRGLQIIDNHQENSTSNRSSAAFSFEHLTLKPCPEVDAFLCASCQQKVSSNASNKVKDSLKTWMVAIDEEGNHQQQGSGNDLAEAKKRVELESICKEQAAKIEHLNLLIEQLKHGQSSTLYLEAPKNEIIPTNVPVLQGCNNAENHQLEIIKEVREESDHWYGDIAFDSNEKEALLKEIQSLKSKLQSYLDAPPPNKSFERIRSSSLFLQSINTRRSVYFKENKEELEMERQRWTEMESDWISLTDDLRVDLESIRQRAEKVEMELKSEKKCTEELDDALTRSVVGHAKMIEHYTDLQEKYNDLFGKHRAIMEGIAEVKRAAANAGKKGNGARFAKSLAAELSALRVEREREKDFLKKENKSLRIHLRDTVEAVHAAGELLVRLREAEQVASVAEENLTKVEEDNERLKEQMEKLKRKHKMEAVNMKQYLAESKLPESALEPLYREDSDIATTYSNASIHCDDDEAWRAEFGAAYQQHF